MGAERSSEHGGWEGIGAARRRAFYSLTGLFTAVVTLDFTHHLGDFSLDGGVHHVHVLGHAILTGAMLAGLASQLRSPRRHVAGLQQAMAVATGATVLAAVTGAIAVLPVALLLLGPVLSALHPARAEIFRVGRASRSLLMVAALVAVPLVAYAVDQFRLQLAGAAPVHSSLGHFAVMATLAVALIALVVVAALGARGWQLPACTAALGAAFLGTISIAYRSDVSSLGAGWGAVTIAAGLGVLGIVVTRSRRPQPNAPRTAQLHGRRGVL